MSTPTNSYPTAGNVWECRVGPVPFGLTLPPGADQPMRRAVERALHELMPDIDMDTIHTFSGWGHEFDAPERAVIKREHITSAMLVQHYVEKVRNSALEVEVCAALFQQIMGDGEVTMRDLLSSLIAKRTAS